MSKLGLLAAVAVVAVTVGLAPVATADPPSRNERSQPVYAIGTPEAYHVDTPHGTIYGEVVRPVDPATGVPIEGVPVILTVSPYNGAREPSIAASPAPILDGDPSEFWVTRGYARAFFDVLGTHDSAGCFDFGGVREREAAAAVVDFLGAQPWTNGKVGMIGISYDGQTTIGAAIQRPAHLAAIIPQAAPTSVYHGTYWGGIALSRMTTHAAIYGFATGGTAGTDHSDPTANVDVLLSRVNPCDRVEHHLRTNEADPVFDEFWVERDYRALAGHIDVPVLLEAGWLDGSGSGTNTVDPSNSTRLFAALQPEVPKRLVVGQWGHGPGQFESSQADRQAWFDHFLLGLDNGVREQPRVDVQPTHGERRGDDHWPPASTKPVDVSLVTGTPSAGQAGIVEGEPAWTDIQPTTIAIETLLPDVASTWVAYQTPPLANDVRIAGAPLVDLRLTSTNTSTHVCVFLLDLGPPGSNTVETISYGKLNSRNRNGLHVSEPLEPGAPYVAPVDMQDTDWIVPRGHTMSLLLSSSSCGRQDDQPGSTNTILDGSFLRLPVSEGIDAFGR